MAYPEYELTVRIGNGSGFTIKLSDIVLHYPDWLTTPDEVAEHIRAQVALWGWETVLSKVDVVSEVMYDGVSSPPPDTLGAG